MAEGPGKGHWGRRVPLTEEARHHLALLSLMTKRKIRKEVKAAYEAGATIHDISKALEAAPQTVWRYLQREGVEMRPREGPGKSE